MGTVMSTWWVEIGKLFLSSDMRFVHGVSDMIYDDVGIPPLLLCGGYGVQVSAPHTPKVLYILLYQIFISFVINPFPKKVKPLLYSYQFLRVRSYGHQKIHRLANGKGEFSIIEYPFSPSRRRGRGRAPLWFSKIGYVS